MSPSNLIRRRLLPRRRRGEIISGRCQMESGRGNPPPALDVAVISPPPPHVRQLRLIHFVIFPIVFVPFYTPSRTHNWRGGGRQQQQLKPIRQFFFSACRFKFDSHIEFAVSTSLIWFDRLPPRVRLSSPTDETKL